MDTIPPPDAIQKWGSKNQANLELRLVRSLAQSPDYRRHPDMLQQLAQLCVIHACRAETQRMAH